jgi:hypothetical protein
VQNSFEHTETVFCSKITGLGAAFLSRSVRQGGDLAQDTRRPFFGGILWIISQFAISYGAFS